MKEAFRLAFRDLRGGLGGLVLLWLCLTIAVAGIAAVTSLASAIDSALAANGRNLLGADLVLSVSQREANAQEAQAIESLGRVSRTATTRAMIAADDGRTALAELTGVDSAWPLAGSLELAPGGTRPGPGEAAIGQELAERLGLSVGDTARIGYARFRVSGIVTALPGNPGFALAPPVVVDRQGLAATGLIQPGSLWSASYRLVTKPGADPEALGEAFQRRFPEGGWRATDRSEAAGGTRRFIERVGELLLLIALVALAIGGLGISSAAAAFAASRQRTIATLKLLGADARTLGAMLAIEIGLIVLLALAPALAVGALTPSLAAQATRNWLPVAPDPAVQPLALAEAAAFGVLVALAAAWAPVTRALATRPAEVFRQQGEDTPLPRVRRMAVPLVAVALAAALAMAGSSNRIFTASMIGGLAVVGLLFAALGFLIRRWASRPRPRLRPLPRLGIAALARPGAATVRLAVALGLGLSLLSMLAAVGSSLLTELKTSIPTRAPALFLVDIPASKSTDFRALVDRRLPGAALEVVPTLRGPVTAINGTRVVDLPSIPEGAWVLRGDRGLTFARDLPDGNTLTAGKWWPADYRGPPLISLDADAAEALGLKVGDRMTVAVLGRPIEARIASLRRIDWRSYGFNFAIIFSPGVLESAPFTLMATVAPAAGASTLPLERALTSDLPMVSAIRVRDVIAGVTSALLALEGAVRLATGLAIAMGIIVLAGSVIATRRARQRDMVLLKLVGATRPEVLQVQLVEFAFLTVAVAVAAVGAGALGAWAVLRYLLELDFQPGWQALLLPPLAAVLLSVSAALLAALPALLARPAAALRTT